MSEEKPEEQKEPKRERTVQDWLEDLIDEDLDGEQGKDLLKRFLGGRWKDK